MDFKADRADAKNNREELDLVIRTISAIVFLPKALNKNCDLAQSPGQLFRSSLCQFDHLSPYPSAMRSWPKVTHKLHRVRRFNFPS